MYTVREILIRGNIRHEIFWAQDDKVVFLSEGNQLFATKRTFDSASFRKAHPDYAGWEAHHILEFQDCLRLGLASRLPPYDDQICVLIPAGGHRGRINSILRRIAPPGSSVQLGELTAGYRLTYSLLGNYCGSSAEAIQFELMQILKVMTG